MMSRREPKTNRSRRALKKFEPKIEENPKTVLFLKGNKSSLVLNSLMQDLVQLKKPHAVRFVKKNDFYPFETTKNLEFLCFKNDASQFCFFNNQKKRPNNLIIGRMFDWQLLDMVEFGVADYTPMDCRKGQELQIGTKPMMCFLGSHFQTNVEAGRVQNMLLDFFRGKLAKNVNLAGLDRLIVVVARPPKNKAVDPNSAVGFKFLLRQFAVVYKKSAAGGTLPSLELKPVGPSVDLILRRTNMADADNYRRACVIPKQLANIGKHPKNISRDDMKNLRGQIHVGESDLSKLSLRKFKATKEARKRKREERREERQATLNAPSVATEEGRTRKPKKRSKREEDVAPEDRMRFEITKPKLRVRKDAAEREVFVKANRKVISKGNM